MSAWHDPDCTVVDTFLKKSQFRPGSTPTYRWYLRSFENVARRYPAVDRQMLGAWLKEMQKRWQVSTLLNQVCIVDRFLDHLVEVELIADNPVAVLRGRYNVKQSKPIWRALASPNPDEALAALRRPAPYGSVLGGFMREHVALMRSRGYQYETQAHWLLRFDRFLQSNPDLAEVSLETMLARWATAKPTRNHAAECQKLARILTKARYRLDPSTPPKRFDVRPEREVAREHRRPHIFSPADVRRLLDIARSYPSPEAPLRPKVLYTMVVLAYCAGLRRGELAGLDLGDVDLQSDTITVRGTKFYKTRILPQTGSVMAELRVYIDARRCAGAPQDPGSGLFWHEHFNDRYTPVTVSTMITNVMRRAGFKPPTGRAGPRVHDLRHSMVVNRILQWYQSGINPQDRLRFLSTYMGHRDINSTLVYITVTQDLLQEASERFRTVGVRCLTMEAQS
ncbi:tyrosine-type recombinase/integrase [Sphingomonas xinjiangensis]|uniref:Integrase n=1 Tax=Sphingomonas xinjiangensis TaxID=643568 RepID=A0A840YTJ9_9SPHN|nr:tyrosine-type recombinase/integrase [Sphingomonas xinjiangensis]MBB5713000.1 integrase [Sphingomonas xinjiangensis]